MKPFLPVLRADTLLMPEKLQEIKTAAHVILLLQKLTAFTKVEFWRDGYRAYRLDVEAKVRPRGGWEAVQEVEEDACCEKLLCGTKRRLNMDQRWGVSGNRSASVLSVGPSSSRTSALTSSLPHKRRKVPHTLVRTGGAQEPVDEWLRDTVGLSAQVAQHVMARLNDEEWGVRSLKMLCALSDADVEEMLSPLPDSQAISRVVGFVRSLR